MKVLIILTAIFLILFATSAGAGEKMPCEYVRERIITSLSYYSKDQTQEFLKCISKFRVCAVADGQVVSSTLIKHLPQTYEATNVVIVQSPANDVFPVCLIGTYSGVSAAAWTFDAYKIVNDSVVAFDGMHRAYAQGDAIPPKKAAIMTYEMFDKHAQKLP